MGRRGGYRGREGEKLKASARASNGRCFYCGKMTYVDRKAARQALRRNHPGDTSLAAYECRKALAGGITGRWHIGHLFDQIRHGEMGRMRRPEGS